MNRPNGQRPLVDTFAVAATVLAAALLIGCDGVSLEPSDESTAQPSAGARTGSGTGISPLANPEGTARGLGPIGSDADRTAARELIAKVSTKGRGPRTGYDRDEFGSSWTDSADGVPLARNGCDTRNDLLARDGSQLRYRQGSDCVVVAMTLRDPYTGALIDWRKQRASQVQIDHVVPLSYGWQLGAARWSAEKRRQFANDPLNLLPVDGAANSRKRDSGPASWLPPNKPIRCAYAARFAQVAVAYELAVTSADKEVMLAQCGG
ncbi:HNH endonuclease family protein [Streptomyces albipurpureus]|uniref:HNH endonuclease family protein n=1 Tax=Streptomyces albipurpureus TaxID=2897419 RepID=A0ABT0US70_9ACTN|nr:HNH endonuclease family protein [Streptomyces sp. CWNU-1]MCM2390233.1 HNH endonuclease family protein [Streptomyces sp. CWNU-1]